MTEKNFKINKEFIETEKQFSDELKKLTDILEGQNRIANENIGSMKQFADAAKGIATQAERSGDAVNEMGDTIETMTAKAQDSGKTVEHAIISPFRKVQQAFKQLDLGDIIDVKSIFEKVREEAGDSFQEEAKKIADMMQVLEEAKVDFSGLNSGQISLFQGLETDNLESYINKIQAARLASNGIFDGTAVQGYATAIEGLNAKQAALLLSTQGLTNAQIAETLAAKESSVAKNYQAMADAGLLVRKQELTLAEVQENLQSVLGAEADLGGAMASLGLSAVIEGQEHQTVQLTAKKLREAVATHALTEAQAQELAMRTGVMFSVKKQVAGTLPKWIASLKMSTAAIWKQVQATVVWMATNPIGWATAAVAGIAAVVFWTDKQTKAAKEASDAAIEAYEESREKVKATNEEAKTLEELIEKYQELKQRPLQSLDVRKEIEELQYEIKDLAGTEAQDLDLVNGRLDEQLVKLKDITAEKARQKLEDARASYYKSRQVEKELTGTYDDYGNDASISDTELYAAMGIKYDGYEGYYKDAAGDRVDWADVRRSFTKEFGDIVRDSNNILSQDIVVDTNGIEDLEERIKRLKEFQIYLEDKSLNTTEFYFSVSEAIEFYEEQQANGIEAASNMVDGVIGDIAKSDEDVKQLTVDSIESFEAYRQKMMESVKSNSDVREIMADQKLSEGEIETAVDNFLATTAEFSDIYEQWQNKRYGLTSSLKFGFTESESKAIDEFQSRAKRLGDALASIRSGDTSGFTDLVQEFPELAGQSGNLEQAITDLIDDSLLELYDVFGKKLPTDVKDDLQATADAATGAVPSLGEALSAVQKSFDTMHEFESAMDAGNLTDSVLSNIGALSTTLNNMVAGFYSETVSADQLYQALTEHYENDLKNYGNALIAKNQYSEEFYQATGLASADVVNQFMKDYEIDLNNCKNYNDAKRRIEQQTLSGIAKAWSQYYRIQYSGQMNKDSVYIALQEAAAHGDAQAQAQLAAIQQQLDAYEAAMDALNQIAYNGIESNFSSISSKLDHSASGSSAQSKETAETFNFIETLVSRLSKAFDKLKTAGENTFKALAARAGAYDSALTVVQKRLETQDQAYLTYMEKANAVGLDEYWASQVRDGSLNIVDVTDDDLKEKIKNYQDWYEKALDCQDALEALKREQAELLQAKIELFIKNYENLQEKLSNKNDRIRNKIDIKEAWGFSGSKTDYVKMNKNLREQIANTIKQNAELKKLTATVERGSEAWYEYQQRVDSNNASLQDMKKQMAENARAAAELAGRKASNKVDKYDAKDEWYDAKMDNAATAKEQNRLINKKRRSIDKKQDAYDAAVTKDKKNVKQAKRQLIKFKKTKDNKAVLKEIQKYAKAGKRIPKTLLNKAYKLNDNGKLYNACVQYNEYMDAYNTDKATAALFTETSKQEKADLALEKFNNISDEYDNKISKNEQKKTSLNNQIALIEEQGGKVSASYYQGLISAETAEQNKLIRKRAALQKSLDTAVDNGLVKKGSEEWYQMVNAINDVTNAIDESARSLAEYNNQIRQLKWDAFDDAMETIGRMNSEADFYIDLMKNEKLTDDDGNFTKYGQATLALSNANYENYLAQAEAYAKEYQELMESGDQSDRNVIKRLRELEDAEWDARRAAEDEKQAVIDLVRQGYDAQLESLNKLIEKYKDLKQNEKDAYEYQKTIAEKTKNIAALQKQLNAYGENDTEEARAKIQQLKVSLEEAQQDLKETEYDKYLSDMNDMLDGLSNDFAAVIDEKFNDTNGILTEIEALIGDTNDIVRTLNELKAGAADDGRITDTLRNAVTGQTDAEASNTAVQEEEQYMGSDSPAASRLIPLEAGNVAFMNEASRRLWEAAQNPTSVRNVYHDGTVLPNVFMPEYAPAGKQTNNNVSINIGDINMHGVNDPETLGKTIREEVCKNARTLNCLTEAVSSKQLGKGIGTARLFL